jgi:hypothetical protein
VPLDALAAVPHRLEADLLLGRPADRLGGAALELVAGAVGVDDEAEAATTVSRRTSIEDSAATSATTAQ